MIIVLTNQVSDEDCIPIGGNPTVIRTRYVVLGVSSLPTAVELTVQRSSTIVHYQYVAS